MLNRKIYFFLCFALLVFRVSAAPDTGDKHILYLNSYDSQMTWAQDIFKGFIDNLHGDENNLKIHYEALDSKDFHSESYYKEFLHYLELKYKGYQFSLIIGTDNNAFDFLLENHQITFPGVPIVFCGVNYFNDGSIDGHKEVTGIIEKPSTAATVNLALQLHPETEEIYVINDYLKTGRALQKQIESDLSYLENIKITYSDDLPLHDLLVKVSELSDHTIILLEGYYSDSTGLSSNYEKMSSLIAGASTVPVYTLSDYNIQNGVVGGKVLSGYYYGEKGAQIVLRILNGEKPENIPVVKEDISRYIFNYPVLLRFSIPLKNLPPDSTIINKPFSFYETYKWSIWTVVLFIFSLIVLLILSISNIIKRSNTEATLRDFADATWEGICIHQDGLVIQTNEMFCRIFGYTKDEFQGAFFLEKVISEESVHDVKDKIRSESTGLYEAMGKRKDGSTFPLEIRVRLITFLGIPARVAAIRDVTDQKESEQKLQSLVKFLDENPSPIVRLSPECSLSYSNNSAKNEILDLFFNSDKPDCTWCDNDKIFNGSNEEIEISSGNNYYTVNSIHTTNNDIFLHFRNTKTEKDFVYLETLMNILFENSLEAIFFLNSKLECERVNQNAAIITGYTISELMENPQIMFDPSSNPEDFSENFYHEVRMKGSWSGELVHRKKSGETYIAWLNIVRFKSSTTGEKTFMATFHDISEKKQREDDLLWMTKYDMLTEFTNRSFFYDILNTELKASERSGEICAIMLLNIDGLGIINNTYGFQMGDEVIKEFSKRLKLILRDEDVISRFGGDEFAVFGPRFKEKKHVNHVINRIRHQIIQPIIIGEITIDFSVSIGISLFPFDGNEETDLLKKSAIALKRTKANRKGSFSLYNAEQDQLAMENAFLALDLRKSIVNKELEVYYQPKVNPESERIEGFEALLRWERKHFGDVSPNIFIPISEENGFIIDIGYFVISRACDFLLDLHEKGFHDIHVGINISAKQFLDPDFIDNLLQVVHSKGVEPSEMDLEITESVATDSYSHIVESLEKLSDIGFCISIDDFGTGYSSLQYLLNFPFDTIKIDKSFINEISGGNKSLTILNTMITLAHSLNKRVVAEGVETEEQLEYIKNRHCELIQGFYYSQALRKTEAIEFLQIRNPG